MRGENPLIFLSIFPIDKPRKMWYNGSFERAPTTQARVIFIIPQPAQFVKRKTRKKIKQIIIPKFVQSVNCIYPMVCYT